MRHQPCSAVRFNPTFGYLLVGGNKMQRDDDYLRELLMEFEASDEWMHETMLFLAASRAEECRHFHVLLLVDAGFLSPLEESGGVFRITNTGHDFLALTRKNEAWEQTKSTVRHIGGASVQMLYRAAEAVARQKLRDITGIEI